MTTIAPQRKQVTTMQSPDHPSLRYVEAKGYTIGRPDGKPLWNVIHDMEASEMATRAENTAAYFANPGDGRNVSSHYTADNNSVVQCVLLRHSAWTVGNRPGNNRGINWELSGFASQTRAQWLDEFGRDMFHMITPIMRLDSKKYDIPLERRTIAELKAWKPGFTSHNDLRLAFGRTTHTDPGGNFPWDYFLEVLNQEDDDMPSGYINLKKGDGGTEATKSLRTNVNGLQNMLRRSGHLKPNTDEVKVYEPGVYDAPTSAAVLAARISQGSNATNGDSISGDADAQIHAAVVAKMIADAGIGTGVGDTVESVITKITPKS